MFDGRKKARDDAGFVGSCSSEAAIVPGSNHRLSMRVDRGKQRKKKKKAIEVLDQLYDAIPPTEIGRLITIPLGRIKIKGGRMGGRGRIREDPGEIEKVALMDVLRFLVQRVERQLKGSFSNGMLYIVGCIC